MAQVSLSTLIDSRVKKAVTAYCKSHGIKLRHFIEQALVEQLEDHIDLSVYHERKHEETIPLEELLD
jgi:spore coat protein CotF